MAVFSRRITLLSIAAGTGFALAAIQILPSITWTNASDRASFAEPRSLPELISRSFHRSPDSTDAAGDEADSQSPIWSVPQPGTHHAHVYQFSVGPWRLADFLWPNVYGSLFPNNRRWISALPAEGRIWTPSMYLGLLPFLLAVGCFRLRAGCPRQRWLSWSLLLAVAASFGWYGIGWLIHEARCAVRGEVADDFLVGPQVGGLYWLMTTVLPGYVYFRYPAKLMVIATLAASLLAATGWDQVWQKPSRLLRNLTLLGLASFLIAGLVLLFQASFTSWTTTAPVDPIFGPLDSGGALVGLLRALLHTAILCLVFSSFLRYATDAATSHRAVFYRRLALIVTVGEIVLANSPLLTTVPGETLRAPVQLADDITADARSRGIPAPARIYRDGDANTPRRWRTTVDEDRLNDVVAWERQTLLPNHHLPHHIGVIESFSTLSSQDYRIFMRVARETGPRPNDLPTAPGRDILNLLAVDYIVVPREDNRDRTDPEAKAAGGTLQQVAELSTTVRHNADRYPRAWIVHRVHPLPPLGSTDPRLLRQRTRAVLFSHGQPRDFSQVAVVESGVDMALPTANGDGDPLPADNPDDRPNEPDEVCRIVSWDPQRISIRCKLATAGLVVVNEFYYPGWRAYLRRPGQVETTEARIHRTNRVMRSVRLPPGEHVLELVYRPWDVYAGAAISLIGWLVVLALVAIWLRSRWFGGSVTPPARLDH